MLDKKKSRAHVYDIKRVNANKKWGEVTGPVAKNVDPTTRPQPCKVVCSPMRE